MAMAAAFLLGAGSARAAGAYPTGGSTFSGGAEGWQVTDASCNVPLCTASGGYDGDNGSPPGSIAANTNASLNLLSLFRSTVTLQSPDFTIADGGAGTLHLERRFDPASLVDLAPQATYAVTLIDRTSGKESKPLSETVAAGSGFLGKDAAASVIGGHTYAISIATETSSSVVGTGLLAGATRTSFDNVSLSLGAGGKGTRGQRGGTGDGAGGAGGLTDQKLLSAMQGSLVAPASLQGKRLLVKARCPAAIGHSCRVTLQGLLKKRKAATTRRVVRVPRGKAKRVVLRVKPKAKGRVVSRKRLLFRETIKAGAAQATRYKRLKLIKKQG